jgi:elongation factor G
MEKGVLAGYPMVDMKVRLHDGKSHSVDSSQVAFEMAGALALRDAAAKAAPVLLEPIMRVEVTVPDTLTGDVMGDLSSRRGRIEGSLPAGIGRTTVTALVPEAELVDYTGDLRSLTSGQGLLAMSYDHHEEVPVHLVDKIIAAEEPLTPSGPGRFSSPCGEPAWGSSSRPPRRSGWSDRRSRPWRRSRPGSR